MFTTFLNKMTSFLYILKFSPAFRFRNHQQVKKAWKSLGKSDMESQDFCSYKGKGQTDEKSKLSPLMGFEPTKCKLTVSFKPTLKPLGH